MTEDIPARGRDTGRRIDTLVIGGSQSGLSVSHYLTQQDRPHLVLERDRIGSTWLSERWDSFTLVTPNWMVQLPGFPYQGDEPDGFLARDEIVSYLEDYAASFGAPVELGVKVERLQRKSDGSAYLAETNNGVFEATNVVVTVGFFHRPRVPAFAEAISPTITQLHSSQYRNPEALPAGAVLVVGSAQSGCQIAEELQEAGREVYLSVGSAGRFPRRYRGKDMDYWMAEMGRFDRTFEDPANPVERYQANPHCSGKNGGHALNLRQFAKNGMLLLGRVASAEGCKLRLAPDLEEKVAQADELAQDLVNLVDGYIAEQGIDAPEANDDNSDDGLPLGAPRDDTALPEIRELDLAERGIATIVWATGYDCDFSWIDLPIGDHRGYPIQDHGVSEYPGLYFCGLHWMYSLKSGLFFGVGEAARHVTDHLAANSPSRQRASSFMKVAGCQDSASAISM